MTCSSCPEKEACEKCIADGILIGCKSFYYVFRYLDEETRMPVYTGDQKQYETAIDDYIKKRAEQPCLQIPKWTNGAFAAELALKYLYFREKRRYGGIHGLYELFYGLPEIHNVELVNRIKNEGNRSINPRYRKVVVPGIHTAENHDFISSDQGSRSSISKSLLCSARSGNMLSRCSR